MTLQLSILTKLFAIGDVNGDGVLLELLARCVLRFPAQVVLDIFMKPDANEDGVIQYAISSQQC